MAIPLSQKAPSAIRCIKTHKQDVYDGDTLESEST